MKYGDVLGRVIAGWDAWSAGWHLAIDGGTAGRMPHGMLPEPGRTKPAHTGLREPDVPGSDSIPDPDGSYYRVQSELWHARAVALASHIAKTLPSGVIGYPHADFANCEICQLARRIVEGRTGAA